MMQELEESIGEMAEALAFYSREELRGLEETVRQLTSEQVNFVRLTIASAQLLGRLPADRLVLLQRFFESWWKRSLAAKLVAIDQVIELSNGGLWPGGLPVRDARAVRGGNDCVDAAC